MISQSDFFLYWRFIQSTLLRLLELTYYFDFDKLERVNTIPKVLLNTRQHPQSSIARNFNSAIDFLDLIDQRIRRPLSNTEYIFFLKKS